MNEGLAPLGLTFTSHQVLVTMKVQTQPDSHCNRMTIANALGLTRGTMSKLVKLLLEKELVIEQLDSPWTDARRKQLRLTAAGTKAMRHGLVVRGDVLDMALGPVKAPLMRSFLTAIDLMNEAMAQGAVSFEG